MANKLKKKKSKPSSSKGFLGRPFTRKMPVCIETIQGSIPIYAVHDRVNLIEPYKNCYTRSYNLTNINYQTASENEQDLILTKWRAYLNSLGSNMEMNLTVFNRNINIRQFEEEILLKETGDGYDHLRLDMNKILLSRTMEGKNGISRDTYITLGVHTDSLKKASDVFKRLDSDIDKHMKSIQSSAKPIKVEEKLEILHDIYNPENRGEFLTKTKVLSSEGRLEEVNSFDFENIRSMGLRVNDVIAPSSFIIRQKHLEMGTQFVRALRITEYPAILSDTFLTDITNMPFNMLTNLYIKPMSNTEADNLINQQLTFIREEKNNERKRNIKNNVSEDMINPQIIERENETLELRSEIRENDEHLFETVLTILIFAPNLDSLQEFTDAVISECKKSSVTCEILTDQQEEGFISTLPLCCNMIPKLRTLKSSSCAIMVPFSNLEINEHDGINYSMNAVSKNLLIYDRTTKANFNGFILGSSGSGKSFTAKTEIVNVFLKKNADIMILDPEQEYVFLTTSLGGQVIPIMPGGKYHINPLDISDTYEFDHNDNDDSSGDIVDPILEKVSFIMQLFESMMGKTFGMDSIQKTLIDECLRSLYKPFMENNRLYRTPSPEETPTLNDMMDYFGRCRVPEARELYFTLKRYAGDGSLNVFSQTTNVQLHNRIVCFDISAVGDELKLMAMNIIQDAMWSRLVENRRIGKFTYIYVDECHIFFQPGNESAAQFLCSLWKRARKYGGVPTGISQNPADMLENDLGKKILSEANFIQVLNQQSDDSRERLKNILNLSDSSLDYITSAPPGQGLFFTGTNCVPFYSRFPKDSAIFPLLTSSMADLVAYKEQQRRQKLKAQTREKKLIYN